MRKLLVFILLMLGSGLQGNQLSVQLDLAYVPTFELETKTALFDLDFDFGDLAFPFKEGYLTLGYTFGKFQTGIQYQFSFDVFFKDDYDLLNDCRLYIDFDIRR